MVAPFEWGAGAPNYVYHGPRVTKGRKDEGALSVTRERHTQERRA